MEGPLTFAFLKDRYDRELARKEELTGALSLPVGLLTLFGSLAAVMVRSFSYGIPALSYPFCVLIALDAFAFVACLALLASVFHRQEYEYLPLLAELEDSRLEFEAYYAHDREQAEEEFTARFRSRIIEAADTNTQHNDERSRLSYWARAMLLVVVSASALAGIVFVVDQLVVRNA